MDKRAKIQELAAKAAQVFELDEEGTVYLRVARDRLSDTHALGLQLAARKLAHLMDLAATDLMSTDELSAATGIQYKVLTARLSDLRKKGWIESPERGKYRMVFGALEQLIEEAGSRA